MTKGVLISTFKDYTNAIECFNRAININPNNQNIYIQKADVLLKMSLNEEAIICSDIAIKLNRNLAVAYNNKCIALNELKRHDEAIVFIDKLN